MGGDPPDAAARIQRLRASLGLSQEQFARQLGVSFATVNRWESGRTQMSARAGEVVGHEFAAGRLLRAHPGHVGMFTASVSFQVMRVPGITNRYFGGDAHHCAVLSGPGTVWLQSKPMPVLAAALAPYLPPAQSDSAVGGITGGLLH